MIRHSTRLLLKPRPVLPMACYPLRAFAKPNPQKKAQMSRKEELMQDSESKFDFKKDKMLKTWTFNIFAFLAILFASSKVTEMLVDKYVYKGAKTQFEGPQFLGKSTGSQHKSHEEMVNELLMAPKLTPKDLKIPAYFSSGRNYFI